MSGGLDWGWFVATVVAGALLSLWTHHWVGPWLVPQARERGSIPAEGQKGQNRRRPRGRVSGCTANHKSCHVWCWAFKPESLVLILQEKLNLSICVHLCEHMWATSCSGRHALACKSSSMCRWKYCKETDWAKFILTQEENGFQAAERGWVTHTHGGAGCRRFWFEPNSCIFNSKESMTFYEKLKKLQYWIHTILLWRLLVY